MSQTNPPRTKTPKSSPFSKVKQDDLTQIGSLGPECNELKKQYDDCFNNWFAVNFLVEKTEDMAPCTDLLKQYMACVKASAKRQDIPIDLLDCSLSIHHPLTNKSTSDHKKH